MIKRLIFRTVKWSAIGLVVVALLGLSFEMSMRMTSKQAYPPPGRMVDLGTHAMHLNCRGSGSPTVLLEAGGDAYGSLSWSLVHDDLARITRTCAYDRAGIMWSDPGPRPRDAQQIAKELDQLLRIADEEGPFVLVGHSIGGVYLRVFADLRSDEVAGMVFVDSSHPEQMERLPMSERMRRGPPAAIQTVHALASKIGFARLFLQRSPPESLPDSLAPILYRFGPQSSEIGVLERTEIPSSDEAAKNTGPYGDIPLVVLTRGTVPRASGLSGRLGVTQDLLDQMYTSWVDMQQELATLSTMGRHQIVPNSEHYIQFDQPAVVVDAIRGVVSSVREAK